MKRNVRVYLACALVVLGLVLAACAGAAPSPATAEPTLVRVAVLPVLDALPLYVADSQGYFAARNLRVEFIPVASGAERDQLVQAGQADAMINELTSVLFFNRDGARVVAVRFARTATSGAAVFRILAGKESGVQDLSGLKGTEIAVSDGTVIAYVTDRLLQAEGFGPDDIRTVAIPKIPDRLAALADGTVKAATVPDPAASMAMAGGAVVIIDDSKHPEYGHSVLSFSADFIGAQPEAVRAFLAGVEDAVLAINADKTRWDDLMLTNKLMPEPLLGKFTLPDYPAASVPTEEQFRDVNAWVREKGLLDVDVPYADSVSASFLP